MPAADSVLVAKLKAAGAIILGKTNVSELNGLFDANMPEGYSSLGGQVLLPSDTDKSPGGSSGGSAAATAAGLAAMTVGLETSTDTAQMIAPAGVAGVVALKPTVGRVSRTGVLPVAKSQDSPGPIAKTVYDAATELQAIAGSDADDSATAGAPAVPNYLSGLTATALAGKKVAVIVEHDGAVPGRGHGADRARARRPSSRRSARRARTRRASSRASSSVTSTPTSPASPASTIAAGHHRLQHRQPRRGAEVPAGPADQRAGRGPHGPGDERRPTRPTRQRARRRARP